MSISVHSERQGGRLSRSVIHAIESKVARDLVREMGTHSPSGSHELLQELGLVAEHAPDERPRHTQLPSLLHLWDVAHEKNVPAARQRVAYARSLASRREWRRAHQSFQQAVLLRRSIRPQENESTPSLSELRFESFKCLLELGERKEALTVVRLYEASLGAFSGSSIYIIHLPLFMWVACCNHTYRFPRFLRRNAALRCTWRWVN